MADRAVSPAASVADSCEEPTSKRRRLDLPAFGPFSRLDTGKGQDVDKYPLAFEVTSSTSDGEILNGGDSGFQELNEDSSNCVLLGSKSHSEVDLTNCAGSSVDQLTPSPDDLGADEDDDDSVIAAATAVGHVQQHSTQVPPLNSLTACTSSPLYPNVQETASSSSTREEHLPGNSTWRDEDDELSQSLSVGLPSSSGTPLADLSVVGGAEEGDADIDDAASDVSDISCASCFSNMSGENWKPISGPISWVQQQISFGTSPRDILIELLPNANISPNVDNLTLWRLIVSMLSEPPKRKKLRNVNSLDDVVGLIRKSKKIIVLTGAGVSVSCGIPDFRSRDGIYARLSKDFPDLPDPQAMFDIHYFKKDPRPFFKFAKEIYPGQFEPSPSHHFIKLLEDHGKLLRNYTQNIDTLERTAGIDKVITCHGSFAKASCTRCKSKMDASQIREEIFAQRIPHCPDCHSSPENPPAEMAVMKPDIVFFGEGLSDEFHQAMSADKNSCDLLIVMGSSLKVRPVALIPSSIDSDVPQILINREPLNHLNFDVELLGDCDSIVQEICNRLGESWTGICQSSELQTQINEVPRPLDSEVNNISNKSSPAHKVEGDHCPSSSDSSPEACSSTSSSADSALDKLSRDEDISNRRLICAHADSTANQSNEPESTDSWPRRRRKRTSLAESLPNGSYLYIAPNRYIFEGAEVFEASNGRILGVSDDSSDDDDDDDENSSSSNSSGSNSSQELRPLQLGEAKDKQVALAEPGSLDEIFSSSSSSSPSVQNNTTDTSNLEVADSSTRNTNSGSSSDTCGGPVV